jgi:hypothetical protein
MDLSKCEWEYDCGHETGNEFSHLDPEVQKWAREQYRMAFGTDKSEKADAPKNRSGLRGGKQA